MEIIAAIAMLQKLAQGISNAIQAGRQEVTDEDLDAMFAEIDASDRRLSDAIDRARAREGGQPT